MARAYEYLDNDVVDIDGVKLSDLQSLVDSLLANGYPSTFHIDTLVHIVSIHICIVPGE